MDVLYAYLPWGNLVLRLLVTAACALYAARRLTALGWVLTVSSALLLVTPLLSAWIPLSGIDSLPGRQMQFLNWTSLVFNLVFSVSLIMVLRRESKPPA